MGGRRYQQEKEEKLETILDDGAESERRNVERNTATMKINVGEKTCRCNSNCISHRKVEEELSNTSYSVTICSQFHVRSYFESNSHGCVTQTAFSHNLHIALRNDPPPLAGLFREDVVEGPRVRLTNIGIYINCK